MADESAHLTVLLQEAVDALIESEEGVDTQAPVFVDGTFGRGGHSSELLARLPQSPRLIAFDRDREAIATARELQASDARLEPQHSAFS